MWKQSFYPIWWTGLIELIIPIEFNEFIQPVNLTTGCAIPHLGKQEVILSGRGLPELDESNIEFDSRLRHAFFVTASHSFCRNMVTPMKDPNSVICAMENIQGQRGFCGDSGMIFFFPDSIPKFIESKTLIYLEYVTSQLGGPLVSVADKSLLGLMSSGISSQSDIFLSQVFVNLPYYYEWIERQTGLKVPKCHGPQAKSVFVTRFWNI